MFMCPQGIAEHGIIERVEMVNFMCHAFLKFEFGPQINFIIGVLHRSSFMFAT